MVSIKDIARVCNVSVSTVSKALNDRADIGAETKNLIKKTAEKMGYLTNASARALKTNKTYNIGVVFANSEPGFAHEYFSLILESFRSSIVGYGYDLTFIDDSIGGRKISYLQHCQYRSFDGVIIITADFNDPEILDLVNAKYPIVVIDQTYPNTVAVCSDNTLGLKTLVNYALNKGHRKIAFIHGNDTEVTRSRIASYYSTLLSQGINVSPDYVVESVYHDTSMCYQKTKELLQLADRPTCIIFPDDYSAIGGMQAITDSGLSVPEDISVMGYDGISIAMLMGLTTYVQNAKELGSIAARKLKELIDDPEMFREHILITGQIAEGKTVRQL